MLVLPPIFKYEVIIPNLFTVSLKFQVIIVSFEVVYQKCNSYSPH